MEQLKKSMSAQEDSLQKTDKNVGQMFNILGKSQKTQRAFQQKMDTLSGLSVMIHRVLCKQFPKSGLGDSCDPVIDALAADLRSNSSVTMNLEARFAAEDEEEAVKLNDEDQTVATVVDVKTDEDYEDELEEIKVELAKVSAE